MPENNLNGKRIMITSCAGLGDLIMLTPTFKYLKQKFPTCHLTVLCRNNHRDVVAGLPYIDKVVCIYRGKFLGRYRAIPALSGLDAIVFTDWHPIILFFAKILRIPIRAGYGKVGNTFTKFLTKEFHATIYDFDKYVAATQAEIISDALNVTINGDMTKIDIAAPNVADINSVTAKLNSIGLGGDAPYILLSPFTGMVQKNLPLETAMEFVKLAESKYKMPVVISAPPDRREVARQISKYALTTSTTTLELVELVRRSKLLVTPDSGPMHVAGALGKSCVALFGQGLPARWMPQTNCKVISLGLECSPCGVKGHDCKLAKCMLGISADMILVACDEFLLEE